MVVGMVVGCRLLVVRCWAKCRGNMILFNSRKNTEFSVFR